MKIIDLITPDESVFDTIYRLSGCSRIAEAKISTSSTKTVYVTDNGRCFTSGRCANKKSLTEVNAKNRYNRKVFLFNKSTTTKSIFGAAELIYCSFNGIDYEDMGRCTFNDGDSMNISLGNLRYGNEAVSVDFDKISTCYEKNHKRLVGLLHYKYPDIVFEDCRDIVSDTFIYLAVKMSKEDQENDVSDFVSVWFFWCKKFALSRYLYNDSLINLGDWMCKSYQNTNWDIYRLIEKYIPENHRKVAEMIARGYTNKDISDELGCSMVESNYRRSNIMRTFRNKLIK